MRKQIGSMGEREIADDIAEGKMGVIAQQVHIGRGFDLERLMQRITPMQRLIWGVNQRLNPPHRQRWFLYSPWLLQTRRNPHY
jgi:hypothetical protein